MPIEPFSITGLCVLVIFLLGMAAIVFEAPLHMDKFKPALFMLVGLLVIGVHHYAQGDAGGLKKFAELQHELAISLFQLVAFMAFMWMIVELLNERGVFGALNAALLRAGLGARGMFWATGLLSALLAPFLNNITTAMVFGKSIRMMSTDRRYEHVALCNIILASNSGVWFLGTATSLMVVLAGKISVAGLLALAPCGLIGWAMSAWVLERFYFPRDVRVGNDAGSAAGLKPGAAGLVIIAIAGIAAAVLMNVILHVDIEFALGMALAAVSLYCWYLKRRGEDVRLNVQLQKVEWNTLMFFIGIIAGVGCLNHTGWLGFIGPLAETLSPTGLNVALGVLSGILDNVPVEAAALMAAPNFELDQWALNALLIGIGGSLTVIGSAAGVMVMSLDRSYTFAAHLKFLPAILVNFFGSIGVWYVQYRVLHFY